MHAPLAVICPLAAVLAAAGCQARVADSELAAQISTYLRQDVCQLVRPPIAFADFYELEAVDVTSRISRGAELRVGCSIRARVSHEITRPVQLAEAYPFVLAPGQMRAAGTVGDTKSFEAVKFAFEKREGAWHLRELLR
jgi:hypothetical protein